MKNSLFILQLILSSALFCSCAHKSGHDKKNRKESPSTQIVLNNNKNERPNSVPVVSGTSNHKKLEGAEIFRRYNRAVFMVFTSDGSNVYQGSGFFIGSNGLAVSNYHVFKETGIGNEAIKQPGDDTVYKVAEIYQKSKEEDFIIFRVNCQNKYSIPIAQSKPDIGDNIFAIGSPRGLENTFSSGEVSQWRDTNLMQISALIDHGSSGGALINEFGEAVGITSGTFAEGSQANLNYAWSLDAIKPYVNKTSIK